MNYTGILLALLMIAIGVIAIMFYEITEYEADKKRWSKEVKKVKIEYGRLYEKTKQLQEDDKSRNRRVIQNVINDIDEEINALNFLTMGLEISSMYRKQILEEVKQILNERLNND